MVLTVSCSHTGLFHSKPRYVDALLPPFSLAMRAAHTRVLLTTEGNLHFRTPAFTSEFFYARGSIGEGNAH